MRINREFWGAKLDDFEADVGASILALLAMPDRVRGILITGNPGAGKTRLLVAAVAHLLAQQKRPQFYLARRLFGRLSAVYGDAPAETEYAAIGDLAGCDFLAIDDLGHEGKPTDFVRGALHEVIDSRHGNFLPTVVSTNLGFEEIEDRYGGGTASRLRSWLTLVMNGRDWRA